MQSAGGEEEPGGMGPAGGDPSGSRHWQQPRSFAGITDEELAAMDPKRAKRLIANRQARQCRHFTDI
jgi:hypothetical protein